MTPEQGSFLAQIAKPGLEREIALTRRILAAIPPEKANYRPDAISKTAFDLAWHIAAAENMFLDGVVAGHFTYGRPRPEAIRNTADIAAWYEDQIGGHVKRINQLSGEELVRMVDFRGFFTMPAIQFVEFSLRHTAHHRGQLTVYLRPMGAKVPSIYGESYDDAEARKAAQA